MPRLGRLHVAGAVYLVGRECPGLFRSASDFRAFVTLIADCSRRCKVRVHAYCLHPGGFWLLVGIRSAPVGSFIHSVEGSHAWRCRAGCGSHRPIKHRPVVLLVDVRNYGLEVVRYLHWLPVMLGLCACPIEYAWSSERDYSDVRKSRWLGTALVLGLVGDNRAVLRERLGQRPGPDDTARLMRGPIDPRVLGGAAFLRSLPVRTLRRSSRSFADLQRSVARVLVVEPEDMPKRSRSARLMLARSVLCWQCVHRHVATVDECARELDRHRSTLLRGIRRDRRRHPQYFTVEGVPDLAPLLPTRPVARLSA
jgi:REP-associated tyrosine transposase